MCCHGNNALSVQFNLDIFQLSLNIKESFIERFSWHRSFSNACLLNKFNGLIDPK